MSADGPSLIWLSVTGGMVTVLLIAQGFTVVMGLTRYFTREMDVAANERELTESLSRENDDENGVSDWDRRYREKRERF